MPKTSSKIDYESSESEDSYVGDYDSYDDELDDSSEEVDEENVDENDINEWMVSGEDDYYGKMALCEVVF